MKLLLKKISIYFIPLILVLYFIWKFFSGEVAWNVTLFEFIVLAIFLFSSKKYWVSLIVFLPLAIFFPIEIWLKLFHGKSIDAQTISLVFETNFSEGINFLSSYGIYFSLFIIFWIYLYALSILRARKCNVQWNYKKRLHFIFCALSLIFFLVCLDNSFDHQGEEYNPHLLGDVKESSWSMRWNKSFPLNVIASVLYFNQQRNQLISVAERINKNLEVVYKEEQLPDIVALVIGESSSVTHWGLNGYERDTTPLLAGKKNLFFFHNVISISNATRAAVPGAIAKDPIVHANGEININAGPSLIKAFESAGYKTYWLSNQAPLGIYDTSISIYAREAMDIRFLNPGTYASKENYDEVLLKSLDTILSKDEKKLIVLHTLGSHFNYSFRYPESFSFFSKKQKFNDFENKELLNDQYDDSIRYTDYILSSVIDKISRESEKSLVLYFSDHGVDPSVGECASTNASRISAEAFQVPFLFWIGEGLMEYFKKEKKFILGNKNNPYMTNIVHDTLLYFSGIKIVGKTYNSIMEDSVKSIRFIPGEVGDFMDYDMKLNNNICNIYSE